MPNNDLGLIPVANQTPGGTPVQSRLLGQSSLNIRNMVDQAADQYGVPRELAQAVATMESNYNPHAQSTIWKNGKPMPGAIGVMQLMPDTARDLGVKNIWDPADNIAGGVQYLKQLSDQFHGDTRQILAAYNAGPGAVRKYGGVPPFKETLNYVNKGVGLVGSASREATPPSAPAPSATVPSQGDADLGLIPFDEAAAPSQPVAPQAPAPQQAAAPQPAAAPDKDADLGLIPVETRSTPPPAQAQPAAPPTPLARGAQAFWQGGGGPELLDRIKTAFKTGDFSQVMPDAMVSQMVPQAAAGILAEPGRIVDQLNQAAEQQNPRDVAYHAVGAIPFIGPKVQQVFTDIEQKKYPEAVGHGIETATELALPKILEAGTPVLEAAGRFSKAAAPDVAIGATKMGTGAAIGSLPIPEGLKFGVGYQLGRAGVKQVGRGLKKGWAAARDVPEVTPGPGPAAAGAAPPGAAPPAGPTVLPPSRQLPAPAIVTPPPADTSGVTAVPGQYPTVEPGFTPPAATPGTTTTPWSGAPAAETAKTPGQVYAESQGIDWSKAKPNDRLVYEQIARAQENVRAQQPPPQAAPLATPPPAAPAPAAPEPPTTPPAETTQAPQTPQQIAQALKAEMEQSGTVAPPEAPPSFAETARAKKVDALFDVMTRNKIPLSMVEQFGPKEWDMLAKYAGVNPPSETSIGQLKQRLADYEKARNILVNPATTPAEAQTAFEQARAVRAARRRSPPIR